MRRARFIAIALAILGAACGGESPRPAGTSPNTSTAGFQTFTDTANGFTIQYPPGWEKQQDVQGAAVVFLSPQEGGGEVQGEHQRVDPVAP